MLREAEGVAVRILRELEADPDTVRRALGRFDEAGSTTSASGYEHIVSRGAHGQLTHNGLERMDEAEREIWRGSDGSGLIKTTRIGWRFFTDQQRARWEAAQHPPATESREASFSSFGPGGLARPTGAKLSRMSIVPRELIAELDATRRLSLRGIAQVMGEALVPEPLRRALFEVAGGSADAEVLESSTDELGRPGLGVARIEPHLRDRPGARTELTFDGESLELLGYRRVLLRDEPDFAPAGSLVGWTSYLVREIVDALPPDASVPPPHRSDHG